MVQVDPIRCWWRTSAGAVRIGETFDLRLTCAVRVLWMVTADSPDIRDSSGQSFSGIEELRLRAGVLEIAAITLAALGLLMIVVVLVRFVRGTRKGTLAGERLLGGHAILARAA